jgi:hypothetical protein
MAQPKTLYERDFVAWSKQQAEALRAAARTGSNQALDWANLAEEIEGLGISQKSALGSQIRRIMHHLLKLQYSRAQEPRRRWQESIVDAQGEIDDLLERSPSLAREVDSEIARQMKRGVRAALKDLEDYGELDPTTTAALRATTYTQAQILGDWLPGEPLPGEERA